MNIQDYLTIGGIVSGAILILGWWLKARLEKSINHEYDKLLELFRAEQRRADALHTERFAAFKVISKQLLALRRYCHASVADYGGESEFAPIVDSLPAQEKLSLLQHSDLIRRSLDEYELFISKNARDAFGNLFRSLYLGFNLEQWLASDKTNSHLDPCGCYDSIAISINDVLATLYDDLGFKDHEAVANSSFNQPVASKYE